MIELRRVRIQLRLRIRAEVRLLREVLSQQSVGVFVGAALPWAAWIAEVNRHLRGQRQSLVVSQYAASDYQALLEKYDMVVSMSRKGNCWELKHCFNAPMERLFGTLKSEWTDGQCYANRQQAKQDLVRFIEMEYNSNRSHSTNKGRTPKEQERVAVA